MDVSRWNEIVRNCAEEAVENCAPDATQEEVALKAAKLSADAICDVLAED